MAGLSIEIEITADTATRAVAEVTRGLAPEKVNPVLARAAVNVTREHLFRLNGERANALGGKRTNFYAQCARGVSQKMEADGFTVGVNQVGFRQRFYGGTILPKHGKYLTIPMRAEAYGKRAGEFNNLRFAMVPGIGPALVEADASLIRKQKGRRSATAATSSRGNAFGEVGGAVMFRLVRKVTQRADPTVLPSAVAYQAAVLNTGRAYAERLAARARGGGS